ncbi:helix-turn-helix domain-containing protein [Rossellomorea marisflavi]|uniref:DNA-binding protein n=1 Tax=Rossellomorea marisflavi TaxID=189381 RepID=A0A163MUR9_9BACI|nr:helix-turn-helix transcriptional regulator [Rossellomorea marisflavi]KZE53423.1 DNA-binding protein [Rossellomorea marisflavi]
MKDERTEIIRKLIKESSPNMKSFAESINLPYTTLRSMLERGIGNASVDNVIKVCKGLGITTDQLEKMATSHEDDVVTVAAHHDGEEWTKEELEEIERFKQFVKLKRKEKGE